MWMSIKNIFSCEKLWYTLHFEHWTPWIEDTCICLSFQPTRVSGLFCHAKIPCQTCSPSWTFVYCLWNHMWSQWANHETAIFIECRHVYINYFCASVFSSNSEPATLSHSLSTAVTASFTISQSSTSTG